MSFPSPFMRVLALAIPALCACQKTPKGPPPAPPPPTVSVVTLEPRPATVHLEYVGELEAFNTVEIRPRVSGLLEKQVAVDGTRVKRDDVLFTIDKQPFVAELAAAQAALTQARAALQRAERDLVRATPLSQINAVSQRELDAVSTAHETNRAAVDSAQAQVKSARLNLDYTTIRSPIDGTVGRVQIRAGGLLTAYQSLLTTVYATDPMYVNFSISERRMLELQRRLGSFAQDGQRDVTFEIVLSDGSKYPLPAALNFVDPAIDARTGTLALRLTVPNPEQRLLAGQFVRVVVPAQQIGDALLVPQQAVQERQGETFVFVLQAGDKVEDRAVSMGPRLGTDWLVEAGLRRGERVVVEGAQKLRPGSVVRPQPRAAAQARPPSPAGG